MTLKKGELTKEAFLRLFELQVENDELSLEDIYQQLFNVGFNKALEIDQVNINSIKILKI